VTSDISRLYPRLSDEASVQNLKRATANDISTWVSPMSINFYSCFVSEAKLAVLRPQKVVSRIEPHLSACSSPPSNTLPYIPLLLSAILFKCKFVVITFALI
jgi:hypothetical protein